MELCIYESFFFFLIVFESFFFLIGKELASLITKKDLESQIGILHKGDPKACTNVQKESGKQKHLPAQKANFEEASTNF